jgi:hypothetical protein
MNTQLHADAAMDADFVRRIAGALIPESTRLGLPGADDEHILEATMIAVRRVEVRFRREAKRVTEKFGGMDEVLSFDPLRFDHFAKSEAAQDSGLMSILGPILVQSYYSDSRVIRAVGKESRSPFPNGNKPLTSDWTLLDPVRARAPLFREPEG